MAKNKKGTKSHKEFNRYLEWINNRPEEPTSEESEEFDRTDNPEVSDDEVTATNEMDVRGPSTKEKIKDHIKSRWMEYLFSLSITIIGILAFKLNSRVVEHKVKIGSNEENISELESKSELLSEENHKQDLKIQQNETYIENIMNNNFKIDTTMK